MNRKTLWFERAEKVVNRVNTAFPNPEFGWRSPCSRHCQEQRHNPDLPYYCSYNKYHENYL